MRWDGLAPLTLPSPIVTDGGALVGAPTLVWTQELGPYHMVI